jgi:hypothetical protein
MDFRSYLKGQFGFTHGTLEQVIGDVGMDLLHQKLPGSTVNNIASLYAHVVVGEDMIVNGLVMGKAPVFNADVASRTGVPLKESPFMDDAWAASIKMNLPAFREYAQQVYAATDAALAAMDDAFAQELVDTPFGNKQPRLEFMGNLGVTHAWGHLGEIAALKGVAGGKGLPF